jgi:hypothetical protein
MRSLKNTIPQKGDKESHRKIVAIKLNPDFQEKEKKLKEYFGCLDSAELYRRFLAEKYNEVFGGNN